MARDKWMRTQMAQYVAMADKKAQEATSNTKDLITAEDLAELAEVKKKLTADLEKGLYLDVPISTIIDSISGKISSKPRKPRQSIWNPKVPPQEKDVYSVLRAFMDVKFMVLRDNLQDRLDELLEYIGYPTPYPSLNDIQDIRYFDGKLEIIYGDKSETDLDSDNASHEPGYRIHKPGHAKFIPAADFDSKPSKSSVGTVPNEVFSAGNASFTVQTSASTTVINP